jgi:tryptophan synthase
MGTTGSSANVAMNSELPDIIARVREYATVPIAVGFGVAARSHFDAVADAGADGVVIGSRIVSVIKGAEAGTHVDAVEKFCAEISLKGQPQAARPPPIRRPTELLKPMKPVRTESGQKLVELPARFGQFGGQYVPEALVDCLAELEEAHRQAMADPEFLKEFKSHYGYINRPSQLYLAENLTKEAGGATIWLKREDL